MDEKISSLKDFVRKQIPDRPEFFYQKEALLSQVEVSLILTEGFKLMSCLVEVESCEKNSCVHNSEQKFVDTILAENGIVGPTLPKVMPDGYRYFNKTLLLLEVFVRVRPDEFEKKWKSDMGKLLSLKDDLLRCGISLVPIVDGRCSYNTSIIPEWATERFRWLLIELLKESKEAMDFEIEDQEYQRLIHSLSRTCNQSLGFENIEQLKKVHLNYEDRLNEVILAGLNSDLKESVIREELIKLKAWYKKEVFEKGHGNFVRTNQTSLLKTLQEIGSHAGTTVPECPMCCSKVFDLCYQMMLKIEGKESLNSSVSSDNNNPQISLVGREYLYVLSVCNKIKGKKIFNTRRNTLLFLDLIILNFVTEVFKKVPLGIQSLKVEGLIIGQMLLLTNDRALDILSARRLLIKKIECNESWVKKCGDTLRRVEPSFWTSVCNYVKLPDFESLLLLAEVLCSDAPLLRYEPVQVEESHCTHKDFQLLNINQQDCLFECLSHISLSLINSMKTSFSSRLLINEKDYKRYFGTVRLKECYVQRFLFTEGKCGFLFYQKTGERSRCFSIYLSENGQLTELGSFYADPKRYFLPIFSGCVLRSMCSEMITWLDFDEELMHVVKPQLRSLVLSILCSPTKRAQNFLQGLRYFIMAFVNQAHHKQLMSKLIVECKSASDVLIQRLATKVFYTILTFGEDPGIHMTRKFKFLLNVSYLCHLITKETPDRLTDQIKCFEKFLEPKLEFGSVVVNPSLNGILDPKQEDNMLNGLEKLFSKSLYDVEDLKRPGISKDVLNYCLSLFTRGKLKVTGVLKTDPFKPSFTSTALDLSSNKSVVVPKLDELGNIVSVYDKQKLISSCVASMAERFRTKGRFNLDPDTIDFLIMKNLTNLLSISGESPKASEELSLLYENLPEEITQVYDEIKNDIQVTLGKIGAKGSYKQKNGKEGKAGSPSNAETLESIWAPFGVLREIKIETSTHEIKDFDPGLLSMDIYEKLCTTVFESSLKSSFFIDEVLSICPLELLLKNLTTKSFKENDFFECFKYILIQAGYDQRLGTYEHRSRARFGFREEVVRLRDDVRVSDRESNSEAIAKRLDRSFFTSAALRNLCFYSEESPTEYTCVSSNTGNMKFGLSYKEQVGSNRELYVGDLNTKMMTRLVEDFAEAVCNSMHYTCLNSESEFDRAICDMKMAVNNGDLCLSMDHSKWGPFMSPALFHRFLSGAKLKTMRLGDSVDTKPVLNVLKWHIHKVVEVPYNVAEAYCTGMLKRRLGLMSLQTQSISEAFFHQEIQTKKEVPSHIMSVLDMGQGILHNLSDLYGLISEQFLNYCLDFLYDAIPTSYTSSDDQITMIRMPQQSMETAEEGNADWLELLCFHDFLSSKLNKFVSPKTVCGTFAAEFKSRFFVMGEETPLLTKFVSAALHNVKCKTPSQLAETIDTICDQCVANGVGVSIVSEISKRVNRLIKYSGYPLNPFLAVENQDVKDWVDGSRGYRLQRNIESCSIQESVLKQVRKFAKDVFLKIKRGQVFEEHLIQLIGADGDSAMEGFLSYVDCDKDKLREILEHRWLNLSANGDLRLVLRTKLMSSKRVLEKEQIPTLVKTLQSKLSKSFTKGAKKILAESINKSAFQASVASGFIGFCESVGSKCVRDGSGGFLYIREVVSKIISCQCTLCSANPGIIFCKNALSNVSNFSRPILWDYFSLVLTNACELGEWVFSPTKRPQQPNLLQNPNLFWAVKPKSVRLIEDQLGLGHVLQSIRRSYPKIFEEHLIPFMSDLQVNRTIDFTRLKYLDVCVAIDMMNENLGIVSHLLKRKDNSVYIVKQNECSVAHVREVQYVDHDIGLSPQQVCTNFKLQLVLSSMISPLVISTSVLKSFFWYNEVLKLEDNSLIDIGELTDFVILNKSYGVERVMYLEDMAMGYVVSSVDEPEIHLINAWVLTEHDVKKLESGSKVGDKDGKALAITLNIQFRHRRHSTKYHFTKGVVYSFTVEFQVPPSLQGPNLNTVPVREMVLNASGMLGDHQSLDGVPLVASHPLMTGKKPIDLLTLLSESDIQISDDTGQLMAVYLDFSEFQSLIEDKYSFKIVGPERLDTPIILKGGVYMSEGKRLSTLMVELSGNVIVKALGAIETDKEVGSLLLGLWPYIKTTGQKIKMDQNDFLLLYESHRELLLKSLEGLGGWLDFLDFSVCFSKSLSDLVISDNTGSLRLKGVTCRPIHNPRIVEDID
ncbi:L protein [Mammarenavirus cupixiense]|uniref:RNA-directed RNA polymerase L n=1 Tax=Cupixi mammarenavirus (isolate Rat/Brasil/BeAn 119303/1970) TaxID=3052304 RepID=L_CPXVB|nr:L protein [Mammarenavirus cupixiense]Q6XQH2.2 RecName: Full=RNA-directed RNA polymerase L; Short=Protein L; AltName: Full=Large structural protein; AltName: Full=Replicase; AltName: Full=Transcriptase; Includes: RecName: Full=cap-snatching endonuclease [Mammarenavirus cupixiense]AAP44555.2 L protein [Mammarenavirus cupixiense]